MKSHPGPKRPSRLSIEYRQVAAIFGGVNRDKIEILQASEESIWGQASGCLGAPFIWILSHSWSCCGQNIYIHSCESEYKCYYAFAPLVILRRNNNPHPSHPSAVHELRQGCGGRMQMKRPSNSVHIWSQNGGSSFLGRLLWASHQNCLIILIDWFICLIYFVFASAPVVVARW